MTGRAVRAACARLAAAAAVASVAGAGCADGPTGPPSGLAVALTVTHVRVGPVSTPPTITAAGDSVVTEAVLDFSGCADYSARAGVSGGALVVTVVEAEPAVPRGCLAVVAYAAFRAVVRPAPRGTYAVVLRERAELTRPASPEREVARATVTVP